MNNSNGLQVLKPIVLDTANLKMLLPHRDLAIGILDEAFYNPTKNANELIAFKKTLPDDPYFIGHYPGYPVLPGHWQYEAMCLASALLFKQLHVGLIGNPAIVGTDGKMRFQRPVFPGDDLTIHTELIGDRIIKGKGAHYYFSTCIKRGSEKISFIEKLIGSFFPEKTQENNLEEIGKKLGSFVKQQAPAIRKGLGVEENSPNVLKMLTEAESIKI